MISTDGTKMSSNDISDGKGSTILGKQYSQSRDIKDSGPKNMTGGKRVCGIFNRQSQA